MREKEMKGENYIMEDPTQLSLTVSFLLYNQTYFCSLLVSV